MRKKVYLVAGHGAGDSGAVGNGCQEAEVARRIVTTLKEKLAAKKASVNVYDMSKNLYSSKEYAYFPTGCEVIEIHLNAFDSTTACGAEVLIKEGFKADGLDHALQRTLARYFSDRGIKKRSDLGNMNHFAARKISYRLVEVCFITNVGDMKMLKTKWEVLMSDLANAIAKEVKGNQ